MSKVALRGGSGGLCLLLVLTAAARATTYGDIDVVLQSESKEKSRHGYFEYVFLVFNRSAEQTHTVTLSLPDQKGYAISDHIRDLRRTVEVGPNAAVRVVLLQPDYPHVGGEDVAVFLDGHRQEHAVVLRPNGTHRGGRFYRARGGYGGHPGGAAEPLVLKSPNVGSFPLAAPPAGIPMMMAPGIGPGPSPEHKPPKEGAKIGVPFYTQFPAAPPIVSWSGDWLAYTRYDGVVVTDEDLETMPPAARIALWQYVETGGVLLVLGNADLQGLSAIGTKKIADGLKLFEAGFGKCIVSPDNKLDLWDQSRFAVLSKAWTESARPWEGRRDVYDANEKFPVVDDIGVPIKGLFVLMFLFTVAIGPINFLILARKKRRIWMLWTTPAISLVTCLAVFAYVLLSEGWEGRLRTETLTLLDDKTHRATTIGWTAMYSPLTPRDGLHFSYQTEVMPQRAEQTSGASASACTIDWSHDQHFASGWIEARVPAHFRVRKSEPRRERVAVDREANGALSIVNGLGVEIRRLSYVDDKGLLHGVEHVAPGARVSLTPKNAPETPLVSMTMRDVFLSSGWLGGMQGLTSAPRHYLRPRSYLAEVDDSPFLEDALRNVKTRKCRALIVGFLSEADEK